VPNQTEAEIRAELAIYYARRQSTAGISGHAFSDQSSQFNNKALDEIIARLEAQLATATRGSTTRYAATSKGC